MRTVSSIVYCTVLLPYDLISAVIRVIARVITSLYCVFTSCGIGLHLIVKGCHRRSACIWALTLCQHANNMRHGTNSKIDNTQCTKNARALSRCTWWTQHKTSISILSIIDWVHVIYTRKALSLATQLAYPLYINNVIIPRALIIHRHVCT